MKEIRTARAVLDAIDDVDVIRSRNPVLFARLSKDGRNAQDLQSAYEAWFAGYGVPGGFNASSKTMGARKRRRKSNKAARSARRANR